MKNVVEKRSKDIGHLRFKFTATAEGGNNGNSTSKFNTKQMEGGVKTTREIPPMG